MNSLESRKSSPQVLILQLLAMLWVQGRWEFYLPGEEVLDGDAYHGLLWQLLIEAGADVNLIAEENRTAPDCCFLYPPRGMGIGPGNWADNGDDSEV